MTSDLPASINPTRLRVEASSFCQLRCPSCPTTAAAIHPAIGSGFLKFDQFRDLLDANPFVTQVELSNYGEVFLNPCLTEILAYAHYKGVAITLGNGVNLNNAKDRVLEGLVKYRVRQITCSIDGASPETYRVYRVRGDFNSVIAHVERINHYKQQYKSELPHLVWQFVIFGHNEHEIPVARQMAKNLGMEFKTKLSWDPDFSPVRDKEFVRLQTGSGATTRLEHEQISGEKYLNHICHQLWDAPQINWDGRLLGCCRNFWGDFGGNAFNDGLLSSLNNEKMVYARNMLLGREPPRADIPCTTCEMYIAMRERWKFLTRV